MKIHKNYYLKGIHTTSGITRPHWYDEMNATQKKRYDYEPAKTEFWFMSKPMIEKFMLEQVGFLQNEAENRRQRRMENLHFIKEATESNQVEGQVTGTIYRLNIASGIAARGHLLEKTFDLIFGHEYTKTGSIIEVDLMKVK
jgi:phage terminase small subunit